MLNRKQYEQIKWIIARSELINAHKRGGLHYQKPQSANTIDMHQRVSGLHLGIRAVQTEEIITWMHNLKIDLLSINQLDHSFDKSVLPNIGIRYEEFTSTPLSTTIHTALEFMNIHKEKEPIVFKNDFWYYKEIIKKEINNPSEINKNNLLIVSVPFFENFKVRDDMENTLEICSNLGVPVMLDLIWLPLVEGPIKLENTDCVEVITHSMTKVLPISGIKGGICLWRSPSPQRHNTYPLGGNLGFHISRKYFDDFGYYHVRDSLRPMRDKWCAILGLEKNNFVYSGSIPKGHFLTDQSLHAHKIPNSTLFNLVPFIENDIIIMKYLQDQGVLTNTKI
jgi:hypothetical protein